MAPTAPTAPPQSDDDADDADSALTLEEKMLMALPSPQPAGHNREVFSLFARILADPRRGDVRLVLERFAPHTASFMESYTPEVHRHLVKLHTPLVALYADVNDENRATTLPPVKAIGARLHEVGGIDAMRAVYYALVTLMVDEAGACHRSLTAEGHVWSTPADALRIAWDKVGQWRFWS